MDSLCYVYLNGKKEIFGNILDANLFGRDITFNNYYKISFQNNIIKIKYNKDYIEDFYKVSEGKNNVKLVNSIIGKNGIGKTALLHFILSTMYQNFYSEMNYIIIFDINNEILLIEKNCQIEKIENRTNKKIKRINYSDEKNINVWELIKDNITTVYFSNILSIKDNLFEKTEEAKKYYNISLMSDLHSFFKNKYYLVGNVFIDDKYTDERFIKNDYAEIRNYRINKNIKYLTYSTLFDIKDITLRLNIYNNINGLVNTSFDELRLYKHYKKSNYNGEKIIFNIEVEPTDYEKSIYKDLIEEFEILNRKKDNKLMCRNISIFAIIDAYFNELYNKINNYAVVEVINNEINEIENTSLETAEEKWNNVQKCIRNIEENKILMAYIKTLKTENQKESLAKNATVQYYKFIQKLNEKYNNLYTDVNKLFELKNIEYYIVNNKINYENRPYFNNEPYIFVNINEFDTLYNLIDKDENIGTIFNFNFRGISSGQQALLDIYSEFFYIKEKIKSDNILVLMDEPELYMHPEWQRKFIYIIIKFFNEQFTDKNIQIIYTTNSPYTLSDIQPVDVITLGSKEKITDTFANNIHTLLRNEFFMESTIGELARSKINEIVEDEGKNNIDRKYKDKLINIIGDELIKTKLKEIVSEGNDKN